MVYAEICGWDSLLWSLSASFMVQDKGIWHTLVGRYVCGVVLGVVFSCGVDGWAEIDWEHVCGSLMVWELWEGGSIW